MNRQQKRQIHKLLKDAWAKRQNNTPKEAKDFHSQSEKQRYISESSASAYLFGWKFVLMFFRETVGSPYFSVLSCYRHVQESNIKDAEFMVSALGGSSAHANLKRSVANYLWEVPAVILADLE